MAWVFTSTPSLLPSLSIAQPRHGREDAALGDGGGSPGSPAGGWTQAGCGEGRCLEGPRQCVGDQGGATQRACSTVRQSRWRSEPRPPWLEPVPPDGGLFPRPWGAAGAPRLPGALPCCWRLPAGRPQPRCCLNKTKFFFRARPPVVKGPIYGPRPARAAVALASAGNL